MPKLSDIQPERDKFQASILQTNHTRADLPLNSTARSHRRLAELASGSTSRSLTTISSSDPETPALKRVKLDVPDTIFTRCHVTLVLETYGETLYSQLPSLTPDLLVRVLGDCIDAHWECFDKAFILHGDITLDNVLVLPKGCALTGSLTSTIVGCPIDLDYSYQLDANHELCPHGGTHDRARQLSFARGSLIGTASLRDLIEQTSTLFFGASYTVRRLREYGIRLCRKRWIF